MIRVLHSVSNMDRAGIETMVMNYYRNIDRSLIQFDFLANKPQPGAYEGEIASMGGRVYRSPGFNPLKFPKYIKYMGDIVKKDDIHIVHSHNGCLGVYALAAAKALGVPNRVYHAHGTRILPDYKMPYKWICKQFINCFATQRLACGKDAARFYYGKRRWKKGEYMLFNNAIDLNLYRYDEALRQRIRREKGLEGKLVIAHVGRFSMEKNHLRLIDMFIEIKKKRPEAVLMLAGDGELMPAVIDKVKKLGIAGDVMMTGNVPDTYELYNAMDLFLMPSIWEGLPVVGVEAQACGVPCVFSTGITSAVKLTDLATFMSLDASNIDWADCVLAQIANNPRRDTSSEMRDAGYDIRIEAKKLQEFYLKLVKEPI